MNTKKFRVNPYLFLLLKKMLEYEYLGMVDEPSALQLAHLIYERHKSDKFSNTQYSDKPGFRDSLAYSKAESLRKYFLILKDFDVSEDKLDQVVEQISTLDKLSSWKDFEKKYSNKTGAIVAGRKFMDCDYSALDTEYKNQIRSAVMRDLYPLHDKYVRNDERNKHVILKSTEEFCLRTANANEVKEIEILAKRIYPCSINSSKIKSEWYRKNSHIFYIYKDNYDLWANINLLPIKGIIYSNLKTGKIYEDVIRDRDLHSVFEKSLVNYIYVEGIACTLKSIIPLFAQHFNEMIKSLANEDNEDLVICALGGSKEGENLMLRLGFEITGQTVDPVKKTKHSFMEIKWLDLKKSITKASRLSDRFNSHDRLTAIDS